MRRKVDNVETGRAWTPNPRGEPSEETTDCCVQFACLCGGIPSSMWSSRTGSDRIDAFEPTNNGRFAAGPTVTTQRRREVGSRGSGVGARMFAHVCKYWRQQ